MRGTKVRLNGKWRALGVICVDGLHPSFPLLQTDKENGSSSRTKQRLRDSDLSSSGPIELYNEALAGRGEDDSRDVLDPDYKNQTKNLQATSRRLDCWFMHKTPEPEFNHSGILSQNSFQYVKHTFAVSPRRSVFVSVLLYSLVDLDQINEGKEIYGRVRISKS
jgi:hypothetical protein